MLGELALSTKKLMIALAECNFYGGWTAGSETVAAVALSHGRCFQLPPNRVQLAHAA